MPRHSPTFCTIPLRQQNSRTLSQTTGSLIIMTPSTISYRSITPEAARRQEAQTRRTITVPWLITFLFRQHAPRLPRHARCSDRLQSELTFTDPAAIYVADVTEIQSIEPPSMASSLILNSMIHMTTTRYGSRNTLHHGTWPFVLPPMMRANHGIVRGEWRIVVTGLPIVLAAPITT